MPAGGGARRGDQPAPRPAETLGIGRPGLASYSPQQSQQQRPVKNAWGLDVDKPTGGWEGKAEAGSANGGPAGTGKTANNGGYEW